MFLAEITAHLENAGPFYPCLIRLVNSAEILSVIPTPFCQRLAQHCQPPSFRIRKLQPLRPELLPKQPILRPEVVDLRLQDSLDPDRQPGCQKLQWQRKRQS